MTDKSVRNALFDPRCGWVLISNGVYLGTSKQVGRTKAMTELSRREVKFGLRVANEATGRDVQASLDEIKVRERERDRRWDVYRKLKMEM